MYSLSKIFSAICCGGRKSGVCGSVLTYSSLTDTRQTSNGTVMIHSLLHMAAGDTLTQVSSQWQWWLICSPSLYIMTQGKVFKPINRSYLMFWGRCFVILKLFVWNHLLWQYVRPAWSLPHRPRQPEEPGCRVAGVLGLLSDDVGQLPAGLVAQPLLPAGCLGEGEHGPGEASSVQELL